MNTNLTILNELRELQSSLARIDQKNVYSVPDDYFTNLPQLVLQKIKANEEIEEISPLLAGISRKMDYKVPADYFSNFSVNITEKLNDVNEPSVSDELETLSPLLSGIGKKMPYSVPGNYFEKVAIPGVQEAKVISISKRSWFRYAAAAVITAIIVSSGFLILDKKEIDPDIKPFAWVEKKLDKVSTNDINEFVQLVDITSTDVTISTTPAEIKQLIKEVSSEDIYDFLEETEIAEPESEEDILN
jgi:hypothetical protein